jgi:uracil phosphoribosyltransferase
MERCERAPASCGPCARGHPTALHRPGWWAGWSGPAIDPRRLIEGRCEGPSDHGSHARTGQTGRPPGASIGEGPLPPDHPPVPPRRPIVPDPSLPSTLRVSHHPAVLHKLAILRDEDTEPKKFREVVRELSWLLGYEALADARVRPLTVRTPLETIEADELSDRIGLIPILRAGLGMVDAMLELMPTAQVWHLGLFRDERTLRPVEYYNKLPDSATVDLCLILDPMLATGGSATAAIDVLKRWGAVRIKLVNLIAAPEGVRAVHEAHPDVEIHCAALDRELNERGYILPGLGDAGDRQFGTGHTG